MRSVPNGPLKDEITMQYGPDFICIGAPKSGTTWLHKNLTLHPEVELPPKKK